LEADVRLELTKKTDLAFQALSVIADSSGERVNGGDLAALLDISTQYLPHVMAPLTRAGWVSSVSGPKGGYTVTTELDNISLLDLIEAVEGPVDDSRCLHLGPVHDTSGSCALHAPWTKARQALLDELATTQLTDMIVIHS
jgi:Rrf2 family protein